MSDPSLRFRQVHLDFHTSEDIPGIGSAFDPDEFAETVAGASVDSITVFARCHHGWLYYPSKRFPERVHPQLERKNLLGEQIEALHLRNVRAPIYVTVQWDNYASIRRPEWLALNADGDPARYLPYEPGFYADLCVNTPYGEFLKENVREIIEMYPTDGIFFDIVNYLDCSCRYCIEGMDRDGIDRSDPQARIGWYKQMLDAWKRDMTEFVRSPAPEATVFYNSGHVGPHIRESAPDYSHYELESLPSGAWGYMHFPTSVRFARNLDKPCLGMTGKFHTSWGDFHSFKNPAALEFECFRMIAMGARCSIGDQLHPSGKICPTTYKLIGSVYSQVEQKEPWCTNARPVREVAVLTPEENLPPSRNIRPPASINGLCRVLDELRIQHEIVDSRSDLGGYKLLILPDDLVVDDEQAEKINAFVADGGKLLASHRGGLSVDGDAFAVDALGLEYVGPAPFSPDFLVPEGEIGLGLDETEHVMYMRGSEVKLSGAEQLAGVNRPYFNRTWQHFCSHRHTPSSGEQAYPGITRSDAGIYFAHPVFTQYDANAPRWCKTLVANAIRMLI
ncbi:MAG: alpha-amylase family protein, partial [Phycisphaerae bacterium]